MPEAKERVKKTLEWRRDYKPDLIAPDEIREETEGVRFSPPSHHLSTHYYAGQDHRQWLRQQGSPCNVLEAGQRKYRSIPYSEYVPSLRLCPTSLIDPFSPTHDMGS